MAAACPKCGSPVNGDFGMVSCDACGELVFFGMDNETGAISQPIPEKENTNTRKTSTKPGWELPQNEAMPPTPDFAIPGEMNEHLVQEPEAPFMPTEPEPLPAAQNASDLSDIAAYGNAEISQGKDGFIVYDLIISGLETKDLRVAVRDALTDKKFMWDADNLIRGTKDGVLRLNRINPVKASLVVRRLKQLPVQVTWEQHVIVEGDPT